MLFADRTATPLGFSQVKFSRYDSALRPLFMLRRRGDFTGLAVILSAAIGLLASSGAVYAQATTSSCSVTPTGTEYSNTATITTPNQLSNPDEQNSPWTPYIASPYPSTITVPSTVNGTVTGIQVRLDGVSALGNSSTNDNANAISGMEVLLVSPSGEEMEIMGGVGSGLANNSDPDVSGLTILIGNASASFPDAPNGGLYANSGTICWAPSAYYSTGEFSSPVNIGAIQFPQAVGTATLAFFNGATAQGTWSLYVVDDYGNPDTITGWDLFLTVNETNVGTTTTVASSDNNLATAASPVTFTATVSPNGGGTPTGTVAFSANGNTISGCGAQPLSGGEATCNTTITTQGLNSILATYSPGAGFGGSSGTLTELVEAPPPTPTGNTWCNTGSITAPDAPIVGMVYPSVITVPASGYSPGTTVSTVSVELNGETATTQNDGMNDQFLLVAPDGTHNLVLLDEAFAGNGVSDVNITVADTGEIPYDLTPTTNETYVPYDGDINDTTLIGPASSAPTFDAKIPQVPGTINRPQTVGGTNAKTLEEALNGAPAIGDWALYVYGFSPNTLSGGWCIDITPNTGTATTTVVTSNTNPAQSGPGQSVTVTATVTSGGDPVTSGTVTMVDTTTGTTLVSGATPNSNGQVPYTTTTFAQGDHQITATYTPGSGFDGSFGSIVQRVDYASTITGTGNTWQYCNPGAVEIQASTRGAYTPNPSNIFVTNFPGTLDTMSLTLNNFSIGPTAVWETASLIESPSGAALDFFSNVGGPGNEVATAGNYTFEDSASIQVPYTPANQSSYPNVTPGDYKATSEPPFEDSADTFISSVSGRYNAPTSFGTAAPVDSSTFSSEFPNGTNPNGTWSLFFNQYGEDAEAGAANGWCLGLVNNPIGVTVNLPTPDTFTQGQQGASFNVNIENNGPGSTGDPSGGGNPMTVVDTLPTGLTPGTLPTGSPWSCLASGQTVTCTDDSPIAESTEYPELTINVNVSPTAGSTLSNSVTASGAGAPSVTNGETITVAPPPALAITKTHPGTFTQGSTAEWDIAVSNTVSGSTTGSNAITVTDTLPSGTNNSNSYAYTLSSYSGTGWNCTGTGTSSVSCTDSTAVTGGSSAATLKLIVNVPSTSPTSVSNTASVYGGGDPNHSGVGSDLSATDGNVPVVQVPASVTITSGGTQSTQISTAFTTPLTVVVADAAGVGIPSQSVTFTAPPSGASGTFSNSQTTITTTTASTGTVGQASEAFTANATSGGPYNVTVTAGTASASPAFSLTNNAPVVVATQIVVSGYPSPVYVGTAHTGTVTVEDADRNTVSTYTGSATITTSDSAAAVMTPATITNGTGTFTVTFNTTGTNQSITAAILGLNSGSQTGIVVDPLPSYIVGTTTDDPTGNPGACPPSAPSVGSCTLRDAITAADVTGGNITFITGLTGTITLTSALPAFTGQITINGPGANVITVSGNNSTAVGSIFIVNSGATVGVSGLTIANGNAGQNSSTGSNGGGIDSAGALTVSNSVFSGNVGWDTGGGIFTSGGSLTVENTTFSGNSTTYAGGAAIFTSPPTTTANVSYSTFYDNSSAANGGAITAYSPLTVSNSTFSANTANLGGGAIANNGLGTSIVVNSIFSSNSAEVGTGMYNVGTLNADYNLYYSNDCYNCTLNNDIVSGNPNLAALGDYGGPTPTMLPLPPSPAICAASSSLVPNGFTMDQRGDPNSTTYNSTKCYDVGAVQTDYALSFTTDPDATGTVTGTAISPAPAVTVTESGTALTGGSASVSVADANADLTTTPATATTTAGVATFSNLIFTSATTDDTLTATLVLNASNTAINLTTPSTSFSVGAISAPQMTAQFGAPSIPLNGSTTLTFTIHNQNAATALDGVGFTNTLPAGLSFVSGSSNCGGTVNFSPPSTATFGGGIIPANSECQVVIEVTGAASGEQSDTSGAVTSSNGGTGNTATTSINVLAPSLSVLKTHAGTFTEGSTATWTITVGNTATGSTTSGPIDVSDTLPANYTLASYTSTASAWTCTGTGTGTVACSSTTPITGGGSSTITLAVNVPYNSTATVSNTALAWGGSDPIQNSSAAAATSTDSNVPVVQVATPNFVVTTLADDPPGNAADCPVGNSPASNDCTLRDAMLAADATDGGYGNVTFSSSLTGTIDLTSVTPTALPALSGQISITGPGANVVTVSGNNSTTVGSIFVVNSGATVGISGLTITDGKTSGNGGGVSSAGTLTVSGSVLSNNSAGDCGGGIYSSPGTLTVENTTFSGNSTPSPGGGGAICSNGSSLTVNYSTFYNNSSEVGGAIETLSRLTVSNSTFSANQATASGGAIWAATSGTVTNSIFTRNSAAVSGDGIQAQDDQALTASYNLYYNNYYGYNATTEDDCDGCASTNAVSGNPDLAALGNYGGPTPTMLPLPSSAAICAASSALVPNGVTTDQRGDPNANTSYTGYNSTTPCVDVGAVQTNYSLSFTTEPGPISPATSILPGTNFEAGVTLDENGAPFTAAAETIPLTLTGTGTLTGGSATTSSGVASYSTLQVSTTGTDDALTATLPLNPNLTALVLSTTSNEFSVGAGSVSVTIGTNPTGLGFSIAGVNYTVAQTQSLTVGTPVSLATTSPQNLGVTGVQYVFSQWSDGTMTESDTLTPASNTTSDTAMFTKQYLLTVNAGTGGTIAAASAPNGFYNAQSSQTIAATPNAGYYFSGWTGSDDIVKLSAATTSVTMNEPENLTANFAAIPGYIVGTLTDDASGNASNCPASPSVGASCTLRDAITAADANGGNIMFNTGLSGTITLGSPLPALTGQITISGPGASVVTVSGNGSTTVGSIFTINSGATVGISGLTIANGNAASALGFGGGIINSGTLTVSDCVLSNNTAANNGGGIYSGGTLTVTNSTFSTNTASTGDGANGGGIYSGGGTLTVNYSTFSGNTASGHDGGAIFADNPASISNSTFSGNQALAGGAIANLSGTMTVGNSIFSGNSAIDYGAGLLNGATLNATGNLFYNNLNGGTTEGDCFNCTPTNSVSGNPNLATLGNYGGPTPTMLPLPSSAAICAGSSSLIPVGFSKDQRGDVNTNTSYSNYTTGPACVDLGAVQTNYSLNFSTEPGPISPATSILTNANFEAGVSLDESGAPLTAAAETIPLTLTGTGTLTNGSATTSSGIASYSTLQVDTAGTDDSLTANLALNSGATPAPSISVASNPFSVGQSTVSVTVGTSPTGLSFTVDNVTYTSPQTFNWNLNSPHTLVVTSPQGSNGTRYTFTSWSDGTTNATDNVTATSGTTTYTASFKTSYLLTTAASPSADGSVSPSVASPTSDGYYPAGTPLSLTATPASSTYSFSGWTGTTTSSTNPLPITMSGPVTETASFGTNNVSVTVATAPAGLTISVDNTTYTSPQTFSWQLNSQHTIATSSPQNTNGTRYTFSRWSDSGALSHTVTVTGAATYTATFNTTAYLLTTAVNPAGSGTVTVKTASSIGNGYYAPGTKVSLSATPANGYTFTNWTGPVASTSSASTTVTMNSPESVTANFNARSVSVTVATAPSGLGIVVDNTAYTAPKTFSWQVGSQHTIATTSPQASNGSRYTFAKWSDSGALSHTITVSGSATYTASFNTSYLLTTGVSPTGSGTVTVKTVSPTGDGYYPSGTNVSMVASANSGYSFTRWTGTTNSTSNPLSVSMNSPVTETANFNPALLLSTNSINFGTLYLGQVSVRTMTLTNTSSSPLSISSIKITSPGTALGDYGEITACAPFISSMPGTLGAGKTCTIVVGIAAVQKVFSPTASTATLTIIDNAPGSPQTVALTALVINPLANLSASSIKFGTQKSGTTSTAQTLTLTNTGNTALNLNSFTMTGSFAIASGTTCQKSETLNPGNSCLFKITFSPKSKGSASGQLNIDDNALGSPQCILLSGTGD